MQTFLIGVIIIIVFLLVLKNKIKLNFLSLFFLTLIGLSLVHLISNTGQSKVTYITMETSDEITEIWDLYRNEKYINDVQVMRTLNPYKALEKNVLEPNQVVTDIEYIYSISNNRVMVTRADTLEVVHEIPYENQTFKPMYLFVTNDKLIVLGEVIDKTRVYIYHKTDFKEFKNFEINATYITSRLIHDELFVISSKIIETKKQTQVRPSYLEEGNTKFIPYENIYYVKNTYPNNYVNIIKTNISDKKPLDIMSYLGLGQVIYFSPKSIYIAEEQYAKETGSSNKTILMKINEDTLKLAGLTIVPGYVLDQYSLNEYKGKLRVATSTQEEDEVKESNHVFVLDENMKMIGKLENFSEGNQIQAAVFIKDKAYIETFNILDPFYVIDLSNEKKPVILSELKFEGYNTNFVPYDENHILAFGLLLNQDKQSIGLKVSLYDVKHPKKVKIISKHAILYQDYNSAYSDVLYDTKALLLDRKEGILGFPIVYWINEQGTEASYYKQFYALYKIDHNGIKPLGKISHYEKGKYNNVDDDIKRGLIINHKLYTVSDKLIKENRLDDLKLLKENHLR